ncbi:MAG: hypothetical protein H0W86_00855, partial [Armatimonadetes bacterium]|nr:hypothetical protein [Armatimonadota bacterium]
MIQGVRVLIAGVGYRWHSDGSFGLIVTDELALLPLPEYVSVVDMGYGAIYASQDIAAAACERLVVVAGVERGREPGRIYRYTWDPPVVGVDELQERIREAGAGVIDVDDLLIV